MTSGLTCDVCGTVVEDLSEHMESEHAPESKDKRAEAVEFVESSVMKVKLGLTLQDFVDGLATYMFSEESDSLLQWLPMLQQGPTLSPSMQTRFCRRDVEMLRTFLRNFAEVSGIEKMREEKKNREWRKAALKFIAAVRQCTPAEAIPMMLHILRKHGPCSRTASWDNCWEELGEEKAPERPFQCPDDEEEKQTYEKVMRCVKSTNADTAAWLLGTCMDRIAKCVCGDDVCGFGAPEGVGAPHLAAMISRLLPRCQRREELRCYMDDVLEQLCNTVTQLRSPAVILKAVCELQLPFQYAQCCCPCKHFYPEQDMVQVSMETDEDAVELWFKGCFSRFVDSHLGWDDGTDDAKRRARAALHSTVVDHERVGRLCKKTQAEFVKECAKRAMFLCPRNDTHTRPFAKQLPIGETETRTAVRCTECISVAHPSTKFDWCSHCKLRYHPRCGSDASSCGIAKAVVDQCRVEGPEAMKTDAQGVLNDFEASKRRAAEVSACLDAGQDLANIVGRQREDSKQSIQQLNKAIHDEEVGYAAIVAADNDALAPKYCDACRESHPAARCPHCGRQPIIRRSRCHSVKCGGNYHGGEDQGGCGMNFNYPDCPYQPRDALKQERQRKIRQYQHSIDEILGRLARLAQTVTSCSEVDVQVPTLAKYWPGMQCSNCKKTFEGPWRLECINCDEPYSLCIHCVSNGAHVTSDATFHQGDLARLHVFRKLVLGDLSEAERKDC